MIETASPVDRPNPLPEPRRRTWLKPLLIALFLAGWIADPVSAEQFALGWVYLPLQSLTRMTVDWPSVLLATITLPLFVTILATVLARQGLLRPVRQARRMTTLFLLIFVAGTATIGLGHQATWLAQGSGPKGEKTNPISLMSPILKASRDERRSRGKNEVKQLSIGIHAFLTAQSGLFPAGGTMTPDGRQLHGWLTTIGPYYGLSTEGIRFDRPWYEEPNARLFRCQIPFVVNREMSEIFDSEGFGLSHVAANIRVMPIEVVPHPAHQWFLDRAVDRRFQAIRDGASHTILLGQVVKTLQPWGSPRNVRDPAIGLGHPNGFGALPGEAGVLMAMADGAVRTLSIQTDSAVLQALATPAGGEATVAFDE